MNQIEQIASFGGFTRSLVGAANNSMLMQLCQTGSLLVEIVVHFAKLFRDCCVQLP